MVVQPQWPLSYEMRYRLTWLIYLIMFLFPGMGAFLIVIGGVRALPVLIPFIVLCAVVGVVGHARRMGRLLLRVDGRGIEFPGSCLFVAWPHVLDADIRYVGEDRALVFRVVRGSVVPLSERGEEAARRANRPPRWSRSPAYYELSVSKDCLDRAALTAVIRAHAPHVTGRFGAG